MLRAGGWLLGLEPGEELGHGDIEARREEHERRERWDDVSALDRGDIRPRERSTELRLREAAAQSELAHPRADAEALGPSQDPRAPAMVRNS